MLLEFLIDTNNQTLLRVDGHKPVNDSKQFVDIKFTVANDVPDLVWTPLYSTVTAMYTSPGIETVEEGTGRTIIHTTVPNDALTSQGVFVSIYAYDVDLDRRITFNQVFVPLIESNFANGVTPPSEGTYEQIISELEKQRPVFLTQQEYDLLTTKKDRLYIIEEA